VTTQSTPATRSALALTAALLSGCATTSFELCAAPNVQSNVRAGATLPSTVRIGRFTDSLQAVDAAPLTRGAEDVDTEGAPEGPPAGPSRTLWLNGVDPAGLNLPPVDATESFSHGATWLEPSEALGEGDWRVYGGGLDEVQFTIAEDASIEPAGPVSLSLLPVDLRLEATVSGGLSDSGWLEYRYRVQGGAWSTPFASVLSTFATRVSDYGDLEQCGNVLAGEPGDTLEIEARQVAADGTPGPWSGTATAEFP
jgi:hypothetical protein